MARPPSFDRAQVLQAVERQFRLTGYAGTSLDDLCAATGLGRGSLYAAFGDKRSLFLAALNGYCDRNELVLITMMDGPDDQALNRLRCFLTLSVTNVFDDSDRLGCMAGKFAVELAHEDESVAERVQADLGVMQGCLVATIEAAQRHGDIEPDAPAAELATLLVTLARGIDVVTQAGATLAQMEAVADRAFAMLPLTPAGRRLADARV